jgi:nucleoside 2-deoxyribosyltransferase
MRIYIAGPMRGYDNSNFDEFDKAAKALRAKGYQVVNPAELDRLFEGWGKYPPVDFDPSRADLVRFMGRDINGLSNCDSIYMLRGWKVSSGALVEVAYAEFLDLEVVYQAEAGL